MRGGLRYQYAAFQAGGEVLAIADQDRVYGTETPTEGATLLKLERRRLAGQKALEPERPAFFRREGRALVQSGIM